MQTNLQRVTAVRRDGFARRSGRSDREMAGILRRDIYVGSAIGAGILQRD